MTTLQLFENGDLSFEKNFDRVLIIMDRRAPTDKNVYFRISADKNWKQHEVESLIPQMEEIELIRGKVFDSLKIIYGENIEQSFERTIFLNHVEFEPQQDGSFMERTIFVEVE